MKPNLQQLKKDQQNLSKKLILFDSFDKSKLKTIAACDIVYTKGSIIAVFVVVDISTMSVIEKKYSKQEPKMPYIPDFLSYRESPVIIDAYSRLSVKPNIIIIRRNGILHPKKIGVASHIGLLLDMPTIGISKEFVLGKVIEDTIYLGKIASGKILPTKEKAKPIFVSPGHKISLSTSVEIVKKLLKGHKMPEPLHIAHKYAVKLKHTDSREQGFDNTAIQNVPAGI